MGTVRTMTGGNEPMSLLEVKNLKKIYKTRFGAALAASPWKR